ncbi:MAG: retropepsin-like aspartic protease [Gammaproteobacteria bacterium]
MPVQQLHTQQVTGIINKAILMIQNLILSSLLLILSTNGLAAEFNTSVPMKEKNASTFYVPTEINGLGTAEFMVDTGSGYTTINEQTLASLQLSDSATYIKDLQGILANGQRMIVPVYRISNLNIGGQCNILDVDVAVFPGKTRQILGLSTLKKAAPFIFSMNPPQLILSHCSEQSTEENIAQLPLSTLSTN